MSIKFLGSELVGEGLIGFRLALHWSEPKELHDTKHYWQLAGDVGTCSSLQSEAVVSFAGCNVVGCRVCRSDCASS